MPYQARQRAQNFLLLVKSILYFIVDYNVDPGSNGVVAQSSSDFSAVGRVAVNTLMPVLTDRQRIELAVSAYLFYALTGAPDVFVPADPDLAARAEADIAELRGNLRTACLEPFADLAPVKRQALIRRLERVKRQATTDWHECPALGLMLMLWCFLKDLTDREVLILWEGSVMDRAMQKLMPMCEYGFERQEDGVVAQERARTLLSRLQAEGLYR
ncbi:hypothetical protein ABC766_33785 (plasmid) [Methylobacterium fujisawaense]|uniref:hypothetical protein n=1 Tax=Methylobacterium fujisawaense TaxID=107400 RepID=UPI0031F56325